MNFLLPFFVCCCLDSCIGLLGDFLDPVLSFLIKTCLCECQNILKRISWQELKHAHMERQNSGLQTIGGMKGYDNRAACGTRNHVTCCKFAGWESLPPSCIQIL